ncbi:unnamed protein product [Vitrella brassicaformis CCMP3155]|uniref:Uncharacterized protein n=2 Tax=Vitrella brassicaformis TaxID=1169539 RepID=A0A0G4EX94_VITBC|nr:unnamed protein product [Vitrella brassicaformis CCMP3155]|eukprot:CEM03301.1 unnamed protein product [Vitrella brassicaformis CCMP3155]
MSALRALTSLSKPATLPRVSPLFQRGPTSAVRSFASSAGEASEDRTFLGLLLVGCGLYGVGAGAFAADRYRTFRKLMNWDEWTVKGPVNVV